MILTGVKIRRWTAVYGGSFGDIFRASLCSGEDVALKRLRIFESDALGQLERLRAVRRTNRGSAEVNTYE